MKGRVGGIAAHDNSQQSTESVELFGGRVAVVPVVGYILVADSLKPFSYEMEDDFHLVITS